jgi:hypothetical protein
MFDDRQRYQLDSDLGPYKLSSDPMGWDQTETDIGRSEKTFGIFLTISNNLQFTGKAKDYLERAYRVLGVQANVKLTKWVKNENTDEWELSFTGYLDFTTRKIEERKLSIDFYEGGLREVLTSQMKEKFELNRTESINGSAISKLGLDELSIKGRDIYLLSKLSTQNNFVVYSGVYSPNSYETRTSFGPFELKIDANSDPQNISTPYPSYGANNRWTQPSIVNMFFSTADRTKGRIKMTANVKFKLAKLIEKNSRNLSFTVVLDRYDANLVLLKRIPLATYNPESIVGQTIELPAFDYEFTDENEIKQGESFAFGVFTSGEYTSNVTSEGFMELYFSNVNVGVTWAEDSFYDRTKAPFLTAHNVGQRLTEIHTGKRKFISDLLTSADWKDLGFTCGGWLRNLKIKTEEGIDKEWPLTISFEDFYNSIHAVLPVGYGIITRGAKQFVALERIRYFFQPYVTIRLGQANKVKRSTAAEFVFASITTGYTKGGDYEKPLGLDEYNIQSTWTTPITVTDNKYDALGVSRADSYAVEQTRRLPYESHPDEDTPYDKDNFLIDAKFLRRSNLRDYYEVRLWQDDFEQIPTGVYSPETAFNLRLTPAHNRNRHSLWFNSAIRNYPDKRLIHASSEGNSELKTKFPGEAVVKENENTLISELSNPMFDPEWIEFEYPFSQGMLNQIQGHTEINGRQVNNYYGLVEFTNENGKKERGYLFSAKGKDNFTFKLLKSYGF